MRAARIALAVLLLSLAVVAQDNPYLADAQSLFREYRSALFFVEANDRVAVQVLDGTATYDLAVVIKNNELVSARQGVMENPTLRVWVQATALQRIKTSQQPAVDAVAALSSGDLKWERVQSEKPVQNPIEAFFAAIFSFFANLFR